MAPTWAVPGLLNLYQQKIESQQKFQTDLNESIDFFKFISTIFHTEKVFKTALFIAFGC